jgi:hypothetical protein
MWVEWLSGTVSGPFWGISEEVSRDVKVSSVNLSWKVSAGTVAPAEVSGADLFAVFLGLLKSHVG